MKRKSLFLFGAVLLASVTAYIVTRLYLRRGSKDTGGSLPNQSIYRLYAPIYDVLFGPVFAAARRRSVQLLDLQPGEHLLISGVGTGLDLPYIAAGVTLTGIDISTEMLKQAGQKPSPANVQLTEMDAQCLEFPPHSFDAALLNLIVSVAPDGRSVFHEAWRVLKPGGRLVLFDKFVPEDQKIGFLRKILGRVFRYLGTDVNRRLSDVLGNLEDGEIEINEASIFFGQYRILRLRKVNP